MFKQALPILEDLTLILEKSSWKKKAAIGTGVGVLGALGALTGGEIADTIDFGGGEEELAQAAKEQAKGEFWQGELEVQKSLNQYNDDAIKSAQQTVDRHETLKKEFASLGLDEPKESDWVKYQRGQLEKNIQVRDNLIAPDMAKAQVTSDEAFSKANYLKTFALAKKTGTSRLANTLGTIAGGVGGLGLGAAGAAVASALGSKKTKKVNPNEYYKKYGKCPKGYNFDGKRCKSA